MSSEHGSTLLGVMCYERARPSIVPFAPNSYQVVIRLDGLTQMVRVNSHGFPDGPVFSRPAGTPLGAYALGSNTSKTSKSFTIPLGARFQLGRTRLACAVAITRIAASDERSVLCAFFGAAGTPQANSWGFALSNLAAYVVHFDAAGHAAGGISKPEPRR
jgi:hypothetical protein